MDDPRADASPAGTLRDRVVAWLEDREATVLSAEEDDVLAYLRDQAPNPPLATLTKIRPLTIPTSIGFATPSAAN